MSEIDDRIDLGTAFELLDKSKPRPMATCARDGEPLVGTFEFRGAEFICVVCGKKYGFLSPVPRPSTPELDARHVELKAQYQRERAAREAAVYTETREET